MIRGVIAGAISPSRGCAYSSEDGSTVLTDGRLYTTSGELSDIEELRNCEIAELRNLQLCDFERR